ncbi:hypothetical protein ACHAWX_004759 [Stephanocyclus meneghinianus]
MVESPTTQTKKWIPQFNESTPKSDLAEFIEKSSCPSDDDSTHLLPWKISDDVSTRSFLVYIPPFLCRNLLASKYATDNDPTSPRRILLAIHGYGGTPSQEIKKWHDAAIELQSVVVAPEGTTTASNNRMGWNAIDCCGDPVVDEVDDLGFLEGVIDVFLDALLSVRSDASDRAAERDRIHVIATGFSNGGFLSSLLGLQRRRPRWLVGIVPTGGYQYDLNLYGNFDDDAAALEESWRPSSNPLPLPMMAHHGGRDGVVEPGGCCASPAGDSGKPTSNCPLDIGINRPTCTSIHTAFEKWSRINGCKTTSEGVDESSKQGGGRNVIDSPYTCWEGEECLAPTELCIWTNEGHAWGARFPGVDLARVWMEKVFLDAESKSPVVSTVGDGMSSLSHDKSTVVFVVGFVLLFSTILRALRRKFVSSALGLRKRKTSEDDVGTIQLKNTSIGGDVCVNVGGVSDHDRLVIT